MEPSIPITIEAAWIVLLGVAGLILQAVIQQPDWTARAKRITTILVSGVLGTLFALSTGAIEGFPRPIQDALVYWLISVAAILVCGQAVYGYLKPFLAKIEGSSKTAEDE